MKTFLMFCLLFVTIACSNQKSLIVKNIAIPTVDSAPEGKMIVWVHGEVKNPGKYDLPLGYTVSKAISSAGGITSDARATVLLKRYTGDTSSITIENIYVDLVAYGGEENVFCKHGDEIYVNRWNLSWYQLFFGWLSFASGALVR